MKNPRLLSMRSPGGLVEIFLVDSQERQGEQDYWYEVRLGAARRRTATLAEAYAVAAELIGRGDAERH